MTVRVNHDEDRGLYALGDDVEGVFIEFVTVPDSAVRGRIDAVLEHEKNTGTATAGPSAAADTSGDYVDNGDGTWTRSSDGATGHFTPAGFTPTPAA